MRVVSTRVLPVPAPASTSTGAFGGLDREPLLGVEAVEIVGRGCGRCARPWRARQCRAGRRGGRARFVEEGHVVGKAGHRPECSDSGGKGQKRLRFVLDPGSCSS